MPRSKYEPCEWIKNTLAGLRPPEKLTVSEWADKYRVLDVKTAAEPGRWNTERTPYLRGIMDSFTDPQIEEIVFVKSTQVGGTECVLNMLGYIIQQDPAPCLVVYPTLELALYASNNRIQPMLDLSSELNVRFNKRESKDLELQFDNLYIVLAGANSPASLASRPIRYLFMDEVDKYPVSAKGEADPQKLAVERTRTFVTSKKIFRTSTPTRKTGPIWQAWLDCDEQREYFVPCPHCGHYQTLRFTQVKFPEDRKDPEDAAARCYYECESCKGRLTDGHKRQMVSAGEWRATRESTGRRMTGFRINALYSPWVRFGDAVREFLTSKDDPMELMNFINSWLGEPWEDTQLKLTSDKVLEQQSEFAEMIVPDGTLLITGGVDVQALGMYWTIRAWGLGVTSWNIAHGFAETWNDVETVMNYQFRDIEGHEYIVNLVAVDSGDQTDEVYEFCAVNGDWAVPVKGSSQPLLGSRYRVSIIDRTASRAHGMRLYLVDGNQYKDMIAARLKRIGKGAWMVYKDCDREYADQICAEERVRLKRGVREIDVWQPKSVHAQNHYLDAEVYCAVAADILNVRYLQPADAEPDEPSESLTRRESWIRPRRQF